MKAFTICYLFIYLFFLKPNFYESNFFLFSCRDEKDGSEREECTYANLLPFCIMNSKK